MNADRRARARMLRAARMMGGTVMGEAVQAVEVKGFRRMLTLEEIAVILKRPVRYVRESLVKPGIIPAKKLGGNSYRVRPEAFETWLESGPTGAKFAPPSGGSREARSKR